MSKYYQTLCALSTLITLALSDCPISSGCSVSATCDVEYVADRVYGCGGIWDTPGVSNGEYLCGDGYSICATMDWATTLGLTKELCLSTTLMTDNYFYASLQSSSGAVTCDATGTDDVFGCASSTSDSNIYYISDAINCGPFSAQISQGSVGNGAWKWGWEISDGVSELTTTRHAYPQVETPSGSNNWVYQTYATGGVVCCIDELPVDEPFDMNTTDIMFSSTEMTEPSSTMQYTQTTEIVEDTKTTDDSSVGRQCVLVALGFIACVLFGAVL